MKSQATTAFSRRSRQRGRERRRLWFVPLGSAFFALGAVFFAAQHLGLLETKPTVSRSSTNAQNEERARQTARNTSLSQALKGLDSQTLNAYFNRYSRSETARKSTISSRNSFVDEQLLRAHPAWQLANALENGSVAPAAPREIALTRSSNESERVQPKPNSASGVEFRAARRVVANAQSGASNRSAIDEFLAQLAARDAARRRDDAWLGRRALENDLRYAERARVDAVELNGVSPEVALELLNLRLELGRNVANTEAARVRARARIREIEARLNAIWKRQSDENQARLRAALEEGPARLRREGLARLDAESLRRRSEDAALRGELRADLERLLGQRRENRTALALDLPVARVPVGAFVDETRASNFGTTPARVGPSQSPQTGNIADGRRTPLTTEIARLRALARRETAQFVSQNRALPARAATRTATRRGGARSE